MDSYVFVTYLDGSSRTQLTTDGKETYPLFTPDKSKIIFVYDFSNLYSIATAGINRTLLTSNGCEHAITPDGTQVYYSSTEGTGLQIWKMNIDGSSKTKVTNMGTDTWGPKITPDGTKFLFNSNFATGLTTLEDVYIANIDGSNIQRLTSAESQYNNYYPTISPDGSKFAYFSSGGGYSDVFVMNIDGTGKTAVSSGSYNSNNGEPSFSPDGTTVVFQSNSSGTYEVHKKVLGSTTAQLTTNGENYKPQYLSNGQILFISERDGRPQLYLMNGDGSGQTRISDNTANDGDGMPETTEKPSY